MLIRRLQKVSYNSIRLSFRSKSLSTDFSDVPEYQARLNFDEYLLGDSRLQEVIEESSNINQLKLPKLVSHERFKY